MKKTTVLLTALSLYLGYSVGATALLRQHSTVQRHCSNGIALTFDDGPHPSYTPQLLDLLKRYRIKATFFLVGSKVEQYPQIVKRMHEEGHAIGIHHYTHTSNLLLTPRKLQQQLHKTKQVIFQCIGEEVSLYRPPWGHFNAAIPFVTKQYQLVLWTHILGDWKVKVARDELYNRLVTHAADGVIFVLHDSGETLGAEENAPQFMLESLEQFLDYSQNQHLTFVKLGEQ